MVNHSTWATKPGPQTLKETEDVLGLNLDPFIVVQKGEPCRVQGCHSPITLAVRGLCETHKQCFYRIRRFQDPETPKCEIPWCNNPIYSKKKCRNHYVLAKEGKEIVQKPPRIKRGTPCQVDGCSIPSVTSGYCSSHYKQYLDGKTFKKVKPNKQFEVIDNTRECTGCHQWKPFDEFYARKNSAGEYRPASKCKKCWIARQKAQANK